MKTILDEIDKGALELKVDLGRGYLETQDCIGQMQRRESWKNQVLTLARRGVQASWIDINVEEPGHEEIVDIYLIKSRTRIANVIYNAKSAPDLEDAHFYDGDFDMVYDKSEVSHWMNLLQGPEEL